MPTNTPRVNLSKPLPNESMAAVGTWWNPNMDIIDTNAGLRQLTIGTLPVSPYVGQHVYVSDNGGQVLAWTGTQWRVRAVTHAGAQCLLTNNQSFPAGNQTLTFATQTVQNFTIISNTTIAAQIAGIYLVTINTNWIPYARNIAFSKFIAIVTQTSGGTGKYAAGRTESITEAADATLSTVRFAQSTIVEMAVGDRLLFNLNHSAGTNQGVASGRLEVDLISPVPTYATSGP